MRKWAMTGLLVLLAAMLSGCGAGEAADTYIKGSDYQYMQWINGMFFPKVQQTEDGCYFLYEGYLYYLDEQTDTILPLCNKADCLHEKEQRLPDIRTVAEEKEWLDRCNACVSVSNNTNSIGIAWCDGYLYCLAQDIPNETGTRDAAGLYRCSKDGAKNDIIYRWDGDAIIEQWIVHRGVLYYVEQQYHVTDNEAKAVYSLNALPLTGPVLRPETVYTVDEKIYVFSMNDPMAYGNYLYFTVLGDTEGPDIVTEENYLDYLYLKTFVYDIRDGQIGEIGLPNMTAYQAVSGVVFWQDRIVFQVFDFSDTEKDTYTFYSAALDGSDPTVLLEDFPLWYLLSDGQYLYTTDVEEAYKNGERGTCWVYDKNMELVDTFQFPFVSYFAKPLCAGQTAYWPFAYSEESQKQGKTGFGLLRWDKSKIGTYNGGVIEYTEIVR